MLVFPNAKINLGLNIVEKRPDGFHNIETVFYPIGLSDILEIIPAPDGVFTFTSTGIPVPGEEAHNLCLRAFRLLESPFKLPPVKMHLHKIIPVGAGLGGGSSDGAFTLKLLNDLFSIGLASEQLVGYARLLGSDCAFFVENRPVFAFERGDHFRSLELDLSEFHFILAVPGIHINTAEAYKMITAGKAEKPLSEIIHRPVSDWKENVVNDFEKPVFDRYPEINRIKEKFYDSGAVYSALSGSGAAVYGLFEKGNIDLEAFAGCFTWESK